MFYEATVWLDDIIVVTRADKDKHLLNQLQECGYWASEKKSEFLLKEINWLEDEINNHRMKANKKKMKAILQLKSLT